MQHAACGFLLSLLRPATSFRVVKKALLPFIDGLGDDDDTRVKVSLWDGEVRVRDASLRAEALRSLKLKLPVDVAGAFVGDLRFSISWRHLLDRPIVVSLDGLYVLLRGPRAAETGAAEAAAAAAAKGSARAAAGVA